MCLLASTLQSAAEILLKIQNSQFPRMLQDLFTFVTMVPQLQTHYMNRNVRTLSQVLPNEFSDKFSPCADNTKVAI